MSDVKRKLIGEAMQHVKTLGKCLRGGNSIASTKTLVQQIILRRAH